MSDPIIDKLEQATGVAAQLLTLGERLRGSLGRGGPRWHRWRALRLRLRAVRVEGNGRVETARALRTAASIHLLHAVRLEGEGFVYARDAADLVALAAGREPAEDAA